MRRFLKYLFLTLATLLLLVVAGVWWVAGSESALQWAARQGIAQLGPDAQLGSIRGSLWRGIDLESLRLKFGPTVIEVDRFGFAWELGELADRRLHITRLEGDGIRVQGEPSTEPAPTDEAGGGAVLIPIDLQLDKLALSAIQVAFGPTQAGVEKFTLNDLGVRGKAMPEVTPADRPKELVLPLDVHLGDIGIDGIRVTQAQPDKPDMHIQVRRVGLKEILAEGHTGKAQAGAPPVDIRLGDLRIEAVLFEQGETKAEVRLVEAELATQGQTLQIVRFAVDSPQGQADIKGEAQMVEPFPFRADLAWSADLPEAGRGEGKGTVQGDMHNIELDHLFNVPVNQRSAGGSGLQPRLAEVDSPPDVAAASRSHEPRSSSDPSMSVTTRGKVDLTDPDPKLQLEGGWVGARWPLQGDELMVRSDQGTFRLNGPVSALKIELDTGVKGPDIPPTQASLRARLQGNGLKVEGLNIGVLGGELGIVGDLSWDGKVSWKFDIKGHDIEPGQMVPDLPGKIGIDAHVAGALEDSGPQVTAQIKSLGGTLRGYPLALQGGVEYGGDRLRIQKIELKSGRNRVAADGKVLPAFDLGVEIDTPDLSTFWPGLAGALKGKFKLSGALDKPEVEGNLDGSKVAFKEYKVEGIKAQLRWPGVTNQKEANQINITGIDLAGQKWQKLNLDLPGTPENHRLSLSLTGGITDLELGLAGGLKGQAWDGQITKLAIDAKQWGKWTTGGASRLAASAEQADLQPLCLQRKKDKLCAKVAWNPKAGVDARVELSNLSLDILGPVLPEGMKIEGKVNAEVTAQGQGKGLKAKAKVALPPGSVTLPKNPEMPDHIAFGDTLVTLDYVNEKALVKASIQLPQKGKADADISVGPPGKGGDQPLGGKVNVDFPNLDLIAGFLPQAKIHKGGVTLKADLGGSVQKPKVQGDLSLHDGNIEIPDIGIRIADLNLGIKNQGEERLLINGGAKSGEGNLKVTGKVDLNPDRGWPFDVRIDGDKFQVVQLPEAQAVASPAIRISGSTDGIKLGGKLTIPSAKIEIKEVPPGSVSVSGDQVIVGKNAPKKDDKKGGGAGGVEGSIELELGNAVSFKGFGLNTRLQGSMGIGLGKSGTTARGTIELREGKFKGYGQDLEIERGRFMFVGPPDNPNFDIRALRLSTDRKVKAYLGLTGNAREPVTKVFTEPSMPDMDALSYLLTGHARNQGEDTNLLEAAANLGLDKTNPAFNSIRDKTGLDDLGVQTGKKLDDAALTGGKYLNPDLYVSYSQNLFSGEGVLSLKYRLNDRLSIQTKSGTAQSVELIYAVEKN